MRGRVVALGLAAAALVGFGVWLGRSSSATSEAPAQPVVAGEAPEPAVRATPGQRAAPSRRAAPSLPGVNPPPRGSVPGLAEDLVDGDPRIRRSAIRELVRDRDADPAVLLAASRDPDLEVGVIATEALGKLHGEGRIPVGELIARATDRGLDEKVRVSALNGLGLVASAEAARLLAELAERGDVTERRSAAILLVHQDPAAAMPALIALLGDADEYVRSNALESLRVRSRGRDFGSDAGAWRAWWQSRSR